MHELLIVFDTIEHVNIVSGVVLNSLLLFLIRRYSRKDLGEYKTLLTAFAGFDIFLCIVHFVISPKVISYDTTFSVVANSFWESRHITLIYVSIFTVPFAIMNINFLYRYWSIKNPQRLLFFSKPYFKLAVFLYAFTAYSMWHLLSWWGTSGEIDEIGTVIARGLYLEKYNRTIMDGWLLMDHWRNDEFNVRAGILLIAVDIIMITSLTVASILGSLTFYFIYKAKTLSMAFRSFQVKLMSALCAQTFVPFVCVYFPYFCVVTFPFLRIPDPHISDACTMLTSCFPTWDAIVIILLMKDYREGLMTLICCRKTAVRDRLEDRNFSDLRRALSSFKCVPSGLIRRSSRTCNSASRMTFCERITTMMSPGYPFSASLPCDFFLSVEKGQTLETETISLEANSCCDRLIIYDDYLGGNVIAKWYSAEFEFLGNITIYQCKTDKSFIQLLGDQQEPETMVYQRITMGD